MAASRPWMFLTSDMKSRRGLKARGRQDAGQWESRDCKGEKALIPLKTAKDIHPVSPDIHPLRTYWPRGHKNLLKGVVFKAQSLPCVTGPSGPCLTLTWRSGLFNDSHFPLQVRGLDPVTRF